MQKSRNNKYSGLKNKNKTSAYHKRKRRNIASLIASGAAVILILSFAQAAPAQYAEPAYMIAATLILAVLAMQSWSFIKSAYKKRRYENSSLAKVDKMAGWQFEDYLCVQFKKLGYRAETIGGIHDFGADLLLRHDGEVAVVQAKRYRSKVGNQAIQQVVAAKAYYNADHAILATNAWLTKSAEELAQANNVYVLNRRNFENQNLSITFWD